MSAASDYQHTVLRVFKHEQYTGQSSAEKGNMLCEYDKRRLANIERNNARLLKLGLALPSLEENTKKAVIKKGRKRNTIKMCRRHLSRKVNKCPKPVHVVPRGNRSSIYTLGYKKASKKGINKGTSKAVEKLDAVSGRVLMLYASGHLAAKDVGGYQSAISNACNKRVKTHRGFSWRFASNSGEETTGGLCEYSQKKILVGKSIVIKRFMSEGRLQWFSGVVSSRRGMYYRIVYKDNDVEDMTQDEVIETMI